MLICIDRYLPEPNAEHLFGRLTTEDLPGFVLLTQEPPLRADRLFVPGECALPPETYNVSRTYCNRHKRDLLLLAAMPAAVERRMGGFLLGMRVHHGRRAHEACGEIVVGRRRQGSELFETVEASADLMQLFDEAKRGGEAVEIEIHQGGVPWTK